MWRAWICGRCHMANERRDWFGFLCEWCSQLDCPKRKVYGPEDLRPPSRPVWTGQRQDDGSASWHGPAPLGATLFPDEVKLCRWTPSQMAPGGEVAHLLSHDGVQIVADSVLKGLQIQGPDEVRFRRHMLTASSSRPSELGLCPFYTLLVGPDTVPFIAHLPTALAVKWSEAPKVALDAMDLINERAGRVYPGEAEYVCSPRR